MEKHKSSGFKTLRSGDFNKYSISIIDNINYIFEKKEIKKASENSEALILYFCIEVPIFEIIVDVFQEHST